MDYDDRGLTALPKLVGGPKYSRPPGAGAQRADRPPDPDDLPLESARTPEDQALAAELGLAASATPIAAVEMGAAAPGGNGAGSAGGDASSRTAPGHAKRGLGVLFRGKDGRPGAD